MQIPELTEDSVCEIAVRGMTEKHLEPDTDGLEAWASAESELSGRLRVAMSAELRPPKLRLMRVTDEGIFVTWEVPNDEAFTERCTVSVCIF